MRYMTRRDLAVVAATSLCLAVIGFGIYFAANYRVVKADASDGNQAVAKQDSPTLPQRNSRAAKRYRSAEKATKLSDHVDQLKPQPEQPLVPAASPVVESAPVAPKVVMVVPTTQPAGTSRPEPSTETWQSPRTSDVWADSARNNPTTSYEQPQQEREERRGMTKKEKIVVGSAIAGTVIASIVLAKKHR
jgi:hypothetical protein